jgi:drug/metabolite transporter (DMT)-like permease
LFTIVVLSHGTDAALRAVGLYPEQGQVMSDGLFLLAASYRTLYGVLGCYLSARLAPQRPQAYALGLGCLGFVLSLLGALATWDAGPECGPHWYPLTLVATAIPAGWLGARLLLWQQGRGLH